MKEESQAHQHDAYSQGVQLNVCGMKESWFVLKLSKLNWFGKIWSVQFASSCKCKRDAEAFVFVSLGNKLIENCIQHTGFWCHKAQPNK